ncbi:hypothetical protein [Piscinibacter sp. XHJ-5]|uniref:hypothetical protein n=1 Tax=Piscinibacter sp. XHJ-5 TaxID=3037797 RepID=UPI002452B470|nr:hypothetical protein [Piscinibacter sp. XHJ-5]
MATGNPGTATVSNAGMSPSTIKTDCEELADSNEARRGELDSKTKDKTLVGAEGEGEGTTVSSVKRTAVAGGPTKVRSAHNNHKAHEKCPKTLAKGGSGDVRGGAPTLCGNYTHAKPTMQKSGHAEARLLDELQNAAPRRMTLNIDWRPKTGKPSKMPCENCHAMLCAARDCKHEITLCGKGNKPVALDQSHCPPTKASYQKLKSDMGE